MHTGKCARCHLLAVRRLDIPGGLRHLKKRAHQHQGDAGLTIIKAADGVLSLEDCRRIVEAHRRLLHQRLRLPIIVARDIDAGQPRIDFPGRLRSVSGGCY